jgi:hypothetical protein
MIPHSACVSLKYGFVFSNQRKKSPGHPDAGAFRYHPILEAFIANDMSEKPGAFIESLP